MTKPHGRTAAREARRKREVEDMVREKRKICQLIEGSDNINAETVSDW